ncbi:hypothetical protein EWM64_g3721 [Hericium alpestre]|uniref:Uncharacterized protein n=1 Tax=Hericium alpestre TaxID=135208 RepID=A0A4Z0A1W2_9AGAM|nr:hypothetical protein EWM64_g3721 [Hericium alpestre]
MYTLNITPSAPTPADIIPLSMPDLEQHRAALEESVDAESSDNEEHPGLRHGLDYTGWSGNWTRTFIERARSGKTLIPLEKIIWDKKNTWGIKVKLEPMRKSVTVERIMFDDDTDEDEDDETKIRTYTGLRKPRLESYQVRATVIDVFIRPAFFQELDLEAGASGAQATSVNDSATAS